MKTLNFLMAVGFLGAVFAAASAEAKGSLSAESFVEKASVGNQFEIMTSQLALEKSQNAEVKRFAQQMIDDHTRADDQLKTILPNTHVDPAVASDSLDDAHQEIFDRLEAASGSNFDREYIKEQTKAHKETVAMFGNYARHGKDTPLKHFAAQTLPTLQQHLRHVEKLKASS
ncbi:MAG: DUF4142 domain-containing protein [Alphaproteobacteria bacterium]|nr:DUF4142 domain-containing protein [Alphaproteobacteria bacterium]